MWDLSILTPLEYPLPLGVLVLILLYISMFATFITQQTLQGYPAGIWGTVKSLWQWWVWRYINNFNNNWNYSLYLLLSLHDWIMCSNIGHLQLSVDWYPRLTLDQNSINLLINTHQHLTDISVWQLIDSWLIFADMPSGVYWYIWVCWYLVNYQLSVYCVSSNVDRDDNW